MIPLKKHSFELTQELNEIALKQRIYLASYTVSRSGIISPIYRLPVDIPANLHFYNSCTSLIPPLENSSPPAVKSLGYGGKEALLSNIIV